MDKKIILSLLIVALIGIVAATYQINNGVEIFNPLSNVAVEENPVTQTLAAPEQTDDAAQDTNQQQQPEQEQQNPTEATPTEATDNTQPTVEESNIEPDAQTNDQANTEAVAQQTAATTNSQPQTASSDSDHVEGSNSNDGNNQGQNSPQSTVVVDDTPSANNNPSTSNNPSANDGSNNNGATDNGRDTSNNNDATDSNQDANNGASTNNNQNENNNPIATDDNAVVPDYSQNEGDSAQLDEDGEVLDSGIDAAVISSDEVFSKLESFVQTRWLQTEPVHLDNAQEYTSDSGEQYYRYDIVRDSDNSVVGQASFNRRTGKVIMMDNSGPTN